MQSDEYGYIYKFFSGKVLVRSLGKMNATTDNNDDC